MDYDQNPIMAFTRYTYEELKSFRRYSMRKNYRKAAIAAALGTGLVTLNFILTLLTGDQPAGAVTVLFLPYILLMAAAFLLLTLSVNGVFYTRVAYETQVKDLGEGRYFYFYNRDFCITDRPGDAGQNRVAYWSLKGAGETEDLFFLFFDSRQAHIVSKQSLENGSPDELRELLRKNLPPTRLRNRNLYPRL